MLPEPTLVDVTADHDPRPLDQRALLILAPGRQEMPATTGIEPHHGSLHLRGHGLFVDLLVES